MEVQPKYLKDYQPSPYLIKHVDLDFTLHYTETCVKSEIQVYLNSKAPKADGLSLDGEDLRLISVSLKKKASDSYKKLEEDFFVLTEKNLFISAKHLPQQSDEVFYIQIIVVINPTTNTHLMGLYKSNAMLSTQCEAEGFRRITFYLDRPDVMATFLVTLRADEKTFPLLLSNGNLIHSNKKVLAKEISWIPQESKILQDVTVFHEATFEDPFPKPCYLFAIVAGTLSKIEDFFTTCTNKTIQLNLWCEPEDKDLLHWSMEALKKSMKWDEEKFGCVFDLKTFHLVAIPHFNMGAMENKGLNLFNSSCLLVSKDIGTDSDFQNCLLCVGHEYFHNWTGNRVTCRDWFQLVIKEGLTTYREQLFCADMGSKATTRLNIVNVIKSLQFPEDASPLAHAVVPESYKKIDNFYTITIYRKGPEIIRLYATILGEDGFRKGMDLYFKLYDGTAVTFHDFHFAMQNANKHIDISQVILWFQQVGTPIVHAKFSYENSKIIIKMKQTPPAIYTKPLSEYTFLHIPIRISLIGCESKKEIVSEQIFHLKKEEDELVIPNIHEKCIPSILRDFSAPVQLICPAITDKDYGFLMTYDTDPINRWTAAQKLFSKLILDLSQELMAQKKVDLTESNFPILDIIYKLMAQMFLTWEEYQKTDTYFLAQLMTLPNLLGLMEEMRLCDPVILKEARDIVCTTIYNKFHNQIKDTYLMLFQKTHDKEYQITSEDVGIRKLKNCLLGYLNKSKDTSYAVKQYMESDNMTDRYAAVSLLADFHEDKEAKKVLDNFFVKTKDKPQLLQKWFSAQAAADHPSLIRHVESLSELPEFDIKNPNFVRALLGVFTRNVGYFHDKSGAGYKFIHKMILQIDKVNHQAAASLAESFLSYRTLTVDRQNLIAQTLKALKLNQKLSDQTSEIVTKIMGDE